MKFPLLHTYIWLLYFLFISFDINSIDPVILARRVSENIINQTDFSLEYTLQPFYPDAEIFDFGKTFTGKKSGTIIAVSTVLSNWEGNEMFSISHTQPLSVFVNQEEVYRNNKATPFNFVIDEKTYNLSDSFSVFLNEGLNHFVIVTYHDPELPFNKCILQSRNTGRYPEKGKELKFSIENYSSQLSSHTRWLLKLSGSNIQLSDLEEELKTPQNHTWTIPHRNLLIDTKSHSFCNWSYHMGGFMWALQELSELTGDDRYKQHAYKWCDYILSIKPLVLYQTYELLAVRSLNFGLAHRPMLDYTTAPAMPFLVRLLKENNFEKKANYQHFADSIFHYAVKKQYRTSEGAFARTYTPYPSIWADDMFMGLPYLIQAVSLPHLKNLRNQIESDIINQLHVFQHYLWDETYQLYRQAEYTVNNEEKGHVPFWSRGNGWAIWATCEILSGLSPEHPAYDETVEIFRRHLDGILTYQNPEGHWNNILTNQSSGIESSGTAIFSMVLAKGLRKKWITGDKYEQALAIAWKALTEFVDKEGNMKAVKAGTNFSTDENDYHKTPYIENDTHGIFPLIFACIEMYKLTQLPVTEDNFSGDVNDIISLIKPVNQSDIIFDIRNYGAQRDDGEKNVKAIQLAINEAASKGGGTIYIPEGEWFIKGAIHLKSHITLLLEEDAHLIFSGEPSDYLPMVLTRYEGTECFNYSPLIYGLYCKDVAIKGKGKITGNGSHIFTSWRGKDKEDMNLLRSMGDKGTPVYERIFGEGHFLRPCMIQFICCEGVLVENIEIYDSPFWSIHPVCCNNVIVRNVVVRSEYFNTDGCDPESSSNVLIENCIFDVGDDGIAIKSGRDVDGWRIGRPSENIVIRNCYFKKWGITLGSEMSGGIRNVYIENCRLDSTRNCVYFKSNPDRGGYFENIQIRNIKAGKCTQHLIWMTTKYGGYREGTSPTRFSNISFENIQGDFVDGTAIEIIGHPDKKISNILLKDIKVKNAKEIIKIESVDNLKIKNVEINGKLQFF